MIKMNKLEYYCLICSGELIALSANPIEDGQIMTHFQCISCQADHCYVEEPYIHPPEKTPAYNCKFCNQSCKYFSLKDDWSDYWRCDPCDTHYSQVLVGSDTMAWEMDMYTRVKGIKFCLRQFMQEKKSRLEQIPDNPDDTLIIIKDFDHLFPDVNPQNIQEKLPIYILFS